MAWRFSGGRIPDGGVPARAVRVEVWRWLCTAAAAGLRSFSDADLFGLTVSRVIQAALLAPAANESANMAEIIRGGIGLIGDGFVGEMADRIVIMNEGKPDRLVIMDEGKIVEAIPAAQVFTALGTNAVSPIQNLLHGFGAAVPESSAGILAHNRGPSFSLGPDSPNDLASGRRPAHTPMPVMVTEGDRLAWVTGAMSGKAQPQIHARPARWRSRRRGSAVSTAMVWR